VIILTTGVQSLVQKQEITVRTIIKGYDVLFVPQGGYISLIDEYANIFEFYGEKKIATDTLHGSSLMPSKYPRVGNLFLPKLPPTNIHDDSAPPIELISPFLFSQEMEIDDSVFIDWKTRRPMNGKFVVKIITVFGDLILSQAVSSNEMGVKFSEDVAKTGVQLLVEVSYSGEKKTKSDMKMLVIKRHKKRNDVTRDLHSAAGNLFMGLFLESKGFIDEALTYYVNAASIGVDIEVYKVFLSNFKQRYSR
jgi:hypothetical protein